MTAPGVTLRERERNPTRSREAILDAAERLFAEHGYEETSLSDVGRAAGMSRATPGYFFGSKAELYRAVLTRCFAEVQSAVRSGRDRALASGQPPDVILSAAVSDYFDFVTARPNFVRLIHREALSDPRRLDELPLPLAAGQEMLAALAQELGFAKTETGDAAHFLFSLISLAWFPHVYGDTLGRVIGLDPGAADYLAERKRHATELLLAWYWSRRGAKPPAAHGK